MKEIIVFIAFPNLLFLIIAVWESVKKEGKPIKFLFGFLINASMGVMVYYVLSTYMGDVPGYFLIFGTIFSLITYSVLIEHPNKDLKEKIPLILFRSIFLIIIELFLPPLKNYQPMTEISGHLFFVIPAIILNITFGSVGVNKELV